MFSLRLSLRARGTHGKHGRCAALTTSAPGRAAAPRDRAQVAVLRGIVANDTCSNRRAGATASTGTTTLGSDIVRLAKKEEQPEFLDLHGLVEKLRCVLPARPEVGAPVDDDVKANVSAILKRTRLNPREWQQHAIFRKGRYTRSIVGHSPGQFVALLLCWERGQQSPIHDHAGAHCFMKLLSGELREERFDWAPEGEAPEVVGESRLTATNDVGFMHDSVGLHRISNPNTENAAVSLHIYSPPFSQCLVFPPTGAPPKTASMVSANSPSQPGMKLDALDRLTPSLGEFCTSLKTFEKGKIPDAFDILDLLHPVELDSVEWAMHCSPAHFSEFKPVQHLVHHDDNFSVMVSCWGPGQEVPPHVVGRGRQVWMKVMHGSLEYQQMGTGLLPWETETEQEHTLPEGSASILRECASKLHKFANNSTSDPAVSVTVYSPPLTQFTFHTPQGIQRKDVPVLTGLRGAAGPPEAEPDAAHAEDIGNSVPTSPAVIDIETAAANASAMGLARTAGRKFLSFHRLTVLLDEAFASADFCDDQIATLLQKAVFDPAEWRLCLANNSFFASPLPSDEEDDEPRQVLVAQRSQYTVFVTFWQHGQSWWSHEPADCIQTDGRSFHGAHLHTELPCSSWTLVLEGELQERLFEKADDGTARKLLRVGTLKEDSVSYLDGSSLAHVSCASDVPCVSLHVEAAPHGDLLRSAPPPSLPKGKAKPPVHQLRNGFERPREPLVPDVMEGGTAHR